MLIAVLMSLSYSVLHSGHFHSLSLVLAQSYGSINMTDFRWWFKLSIIRMVFPDHSDLYSNFITKLLHEESPIDCARWWLLIVLLTFRVAIAIDWFSLRSLKESMWGNHLSDLLFSREVQKVFVWLFLCFRTFLFSNNSFL